MKKIYVIASLALTINAFAQSNAIPNGGFENWTSSTCDNPQYYPFTTNPQAFQSGAPFNVVKSTDAYHGSFAIQITTEISATHDTIQGGFFNINPDNGKGQGSGQYPAWHGGFAYNQKPTGIRGYYKSAIASPDTGRIIIMFKHSGVDTAMYFFPLYGTHSTYTLFSFTFNPPLPSTPDTVIFAIMSSDPMNKSIDRNGSMLKIDSLSFTGVSSQPAQLNGDFELWQTQTFTNLDNWYVQGGGNNGLSGVIQTTDKVAGNYAAELITQQGTRGNGGGGGVPAANASSISTGYYPNNCGGSCVQRGGRPFSNQIDTLCFYYKYAPSGSDTAQANVNFKKNFVNVWGTGINLLTASTYTYMEIPFNTMMSIDTVIVSFQSSNWRDSALSFVGSILKVDEAHFKSQPLTTGIKTFDASIGNKIFPNPSSDGNFIVSNVNTFDLVRVYNVYGQEVNAQIVKQNDYANIQINAAGAYFVQINSSGKITTQKVIISPN
ncbi:MAG TPA: T9SS type A sorting domain-containing protein [Bacteroidia bacterium]